MTNANANRAIGMEKSLRHTQSSGKMTIISVEDKISVAPRNIVHFLIVLAATSLEQKCRAHQCSQFVAATTICADETL